MNLHAYEDSNLHTPNVSSFLDTVVLAHSLEIRHGTIHAAFLTDPYGDVTDYCLLDEPDDSVVAAATWAEEVKRLDGFTARSATTVVLISAGHHSANGNSPADLAVLDQLRARLQSVGLFLRDWVQSDRGHVRSVAMADEAPAGLPGPGPGLGPEPKPGHAWHAARAAA